MTLAEAFADWGGEARPETGTRQPDRKTVRLKSVVPSKGENNELVLVVRIEFNEEDIGA
jgi:hypothetical protein